MSKKCARKRDIITKDVEKNVRGLVKLLVVDYSQREMIIVDESPRRCGEEKKVGLSCCSFVVQDKFPSS